MGRVPRDRDEESGRFTERYGEETFLEALEDHEGAASTTEVAEAVGCSYRTAHAKLTALAEAGELESRQVGNAYLWQLENE